MWRSPAIQEWRRLDAEAAREGSFSRLVIFTHGDFTSVENGSHLRMVEQIAFAGQRFAHVAVYSHRQHPSHPWDSAGEARFRRRFPDIALILEDAPRHLRWSTRIKNIALALVPGAAPLTLKAAVPGTPCYARLRRDRDCVFWLNFIDACTVLNGIPQRFIVETHDIRFVKQSKKLKRPTYSLRMIGKMRSEIAMMEQAQIAVSISPVDYAVLSSLTRGVTHYHVPSYAIDSVQVETYGGYSADLLFVGANNNFNVSGLCKFLNEQAAWLEQRIVHVAGKVCENQRIQQAARHLPSVKLLGFVDDVSPVYASAKAVISPVEGTGLKIKVVEALAHGKPVFGSVHSREALPPSYEACVFPLHTELMDGLLDDPDKLRAAHEAAQTYYRHFVAAGDRARLVEHLVRNLGLARATSDSCAHTTTWSC